jgi:hypothetical protein
VPMLNCAAREFAIAPELFHWRVDGQSARLPSPEESSRRPEHA